MFLSAHVTLNASVRFTHEVILMSQTVIECICHWVIVITE